MKNALIESATFREEINQAYTRIIFLLIAVVSLLFFSFNSEHDITLLTTLTTVGVIGSMGHFLFLNALPERFESQRKYVPIVFDMIAVSAFVALVPSDGMLFAPLYLWVIIGNGIRFGARYLFAAMAMACVSLVSIYFLTPYDQQQSAALLGWMLAVTILPLFYAKLLKRSKHNYDALLRSKVQTQKAEQTYRLLFECSEDPMWVLYQNRFVLANNAALGVMGIEQGSAFEPLHPADISPPLQPNDKRSLECAEEMMRIAMQKGYHRFEWLHERRDGSQFFVEVSLTRIPYESGEGLFCIWRDITEQKRDQEALINAKNTAEALFMNATAALVVINAQGKPYKVNRKFIAIFGYGIDEVPSMDTWFEKTCPDAIYREKVRQKWSSRVCTAMEGKGEIEADEYRITCKDGRLCVAQISGMMIGEELLVTLVDISERKRIEKDLVVAKKVADEANRIKSLFLSNMSHELRKPLHALLDLCGLLNEQELSARERDILEKIDASLKQLTRIVNDMFDFSCIESSTLLIEHNGAESSGLIEKGAPSASAAAVAGKRILIVDDNRTNQLVVKGMLEQYNMPLDVVDDGKAALERFEKGKYALILMDMKMPVMDGYEATQSIRQIDFHVPIIAVSAYIDEDELELMRKVGINTYVKKPIDPYELITTINRFLE